MCRNNRSMIEMVFLQNSMIREFFQNSNMIEMVFLQNGMIREFFTEFFMNSSMIDMVFVQNGMIREFLNNRNMGMIVLMIFGMSAEPLNNHNMGMIVFLNSNSVVNVLGASAFSFEEQHAWLIDSGASCHMIGEGMLDGGHVEILKVKLGRGDQEVTLGTTVFGNVGWCYTIPTRRGGPALKDHELRLPAHGGGADGSERGKLVAGDVASNVTRTVSPSTSSSSSTPPRPQKSGMEPQEVGMEPRETPYPVDVEALPGPQSDLEQVPGLQRSLTKADEEPKVPKSKKRPQPAVQPFPERSVTEDQKAEASKGKGAVRSEVVTVEESSPPRTATVEKKKKEGDCMPAAAADGYQPATGATEEHATATKEHARALGGQEEEEAFPHASPEEIDSEAAKISESGADGGARVDANPGQHVPYEEEEKS
ncbi:unnamed protein product, partial [Symbiodinium sp. KB8]